MHTRSPVRVHVAMLLLGLVQSSAACRSQQPSIHDSTEALPEVAGWIVKSRPRGGIVAWSLPARLESVVRVPAAERVERFSTVHALAGPDAEGRIAYLEDRFFGEAEAERSHALKTIRVDGTEDRRIFERAGSAMWAGSAIGHGEVGKQLALAPTGGLVSFVSGLSPKQMPGSLLLNGTLEVWNVVDGVRVPSQQSALDLPMSWFQGGRQLCFVKLVARADLPASVGELDAYGSFVRSWDEVPAVHVLDLDSGRSRFLHVGWLPVVASDGRSELVGWWHSNSELAWRRVDVATGHTSPLPLPRDAQCLAALPFDRVVFRSAMGSEERATGRWPSGKPPRLAVWIARLGTGERASLLDDVDPLDCVSFGIDPK